MWGGTEIFGAGAGASKEEAPTGPIPKGKSMSHFLTVRFPGKQRNEYGAPAAFFKVADPAAGRTLLTLFGEDYGAAAPKGPGLVFDLVAAEGLSHAQAVRFDTTVGQVEETWEQAYSVTDGPNFSAGRTGELARLYDRAEKWQAAMPEGQQAAPIPKAAPASGGDTREIPEASNLTMAPCHRLAGAMGAVFPRRRAILAVALLIVLELFAVIGVCLWGDAIQKIVNRWWLLGSQLPFVLLVSRLILGRTGWSQVKKMWHSWWGEP